MKQHSDLKNLFVADHPLIQHKLTHMRDVACEKAMFKALLKEISLLMGYEITHSLELTTKRVRTPLCEMDAPVLTDKKPVIIPILRAGLGMSEALEELIPTAHYGHIGMYRDEETKRPVEYLVKLPKLEGRSIILVDPMLATGYSAKCTLDILVREGADPANIKFMALLVAPEGVQVLADAYPQVRIYTAALDEKLNEKSYIVPGLGDAGDRMFGTLD